MMKQERLATLPSVLTEYGPIPGQVKSKRSDIKDEERAPSSNNLQAERTNRDRGKSRRIRSPQIHLHDEKRRGSRKGTEGERLEWVADTWDQARAEIRQERHEILAQKLVLQQALVRAQDRRAQQRRQQQEEDHTKKRAEEKRVRKEKLEALEGQCKQSLASDRKSRRKPRTASESDDHNNTQARNDADGQSSDAESTATSTTGGRRERTKGHSGYLPSEAFVPTSQPMLENEEEEQEEEESGGPKDRAPVGVVTPTDLNSVPWHHAQLYKMYGRNADYYIHPKMQVEKKKVVHPTLKRQKGQAYRSISELEYPGHLGAGHIWTTLRSDSTNKLLRTDRRFPVELKEAFGAHVRDGITKHKKPVFRNFAETEDVPDLPRLLDQSLLRRIRVLRHKTELMYRSSQTNHDRTNILLFNSPLPEPCEGDVGIGKYLPSWDLDNVSDTSEAPYMKWVKKNHIPQKGSHQDLSGSLNEEEVAALGGAGTDDEDDNEATDGELEDEEEEDRVAGDGHEVAPAHRKMWHPQSVLTPLGSDMNESLHDIWHRVMARQRPRREPRYHFLTEEEARVQGEFLAKLGLEPDKIDRGRTDLLPQLDRAQGKGRLSQGRLSLPTSVKAMSAPRGDRSGGLRYSSTGPGLAGRSESAQQPKLGPPSALCNYESRWQPLSMQALVEYKEQLETEGAGEFSQGRPPMWRLGEATAGAE